VNVHLDTHVALWLAAGDKRRLRGIQSRLRRSALFISPVVLVEMEVLKEIGRIRSPVGEVWEILSEDHGVAEATGDVRAIGSHARGLGWTRDPFDRFIVAHALAEGAMLLTADGTIREHCAQASWKA
jgi:PIN domain nuclease of toxin-antitoxin system